MRKIVKDLKKYTMFSFVSAKCQLKAEVANSYLNWIWWVLEPFCFMLIYALIFGVVFKSQEQNFPLFIFVGITLWDFFNRTVSVSVKLVRNNKGIVSKVYIPKYILLLTKVWVNGFKMLISFTIIAGMMIFYKIPVTLNILYCIPILLTLMIISFGIGTILMHFGVFLDDLHNFINIALKVLFYITGVFYNVSARIPAPYGEILGKVNPVAFLLESMRKCLLYGQSPDLAFLVLWFVVGCIVLLIGLKVIYKNENSYVKAL